MLYLSKKSCLPLIALSVFAMVLSDNAFAQLEEILVTARKREQSVVMISLEDYEALEETAYLLRSPANAKRLIASIEAAEQGNVVEKKIELME